MLPNQATSMASVELKQGIKQPSYQMQPPGLRQRKQLFAALPIGVTSRMT